MNTTSTMNNFKDNPDLLVLTKKRIRSKILTRFKLHKEEGRNRKSEVIKRKLFRSQVFKRAKVVMFFISFGQEVNTHDMIRETRELGKTVAVPVCKSDRTIKPSIFPDKAKLIHGLYEMYEPGIKKFINLKKLDLVIVPGLAFDKKGNRLGRGKGYYDRFLARLSCKTSVVGLAFDFQILPSVPVAEWDKKVHKVIFA